MKDTENIILNIEQVILCFQYDPAKCFLFDCKHPTVCQFTPFDGYSSISLPRGSSSLSFSTSSSSISSPFGSSSSSSSPHVRRVNVPSPRGPPPTTSTYSSTTTSTSRPTSSSRKTTSVPFFAETQDTDLDTWRQLVADDEESQKTKENQDQHATVNPGMYGQNNGTSGPQQ